MFNIIVTKRNLEEKFVFNDICKNEIETHIVRNFIKELVLFKQNNFNKLLEDFFISRAIKLKTKSKVVNNIKLFCNLIKKEIELKNKSNLNIYLVKETKENKEIISYWFMDIA